MSKIVVGLDASPSSRAALAWAANYARMTGLPVQAIHAMPVPANLASVGMLGESAPEPADSIDANYRREIEEVFASVDPLPGWRLEFYIDDPGPAVVTASEGAALVVVGTREHRGLGRLVYGSVSRYCLGHAKVPVIAVPFPAVEVPLPAAEQPPAQQPPAQQPDAEPKSD